MNIFINKHVLKTIICHNTDITFALQSHFGLIRPFSRIYLDFPGGTSGKEPTCQCRKPKSYQFDLWVRKIPWRWKWQPTPVFLPGESIDRGAWQTIYQEKLYCLKNVKQPHKKPIST